MKKIVFIFAICMFLSVVGNAQETKSVLDFSNLTVQTFPCQTKDSLERLEFKTPLELSMYCSKRAEKAITGAHDDFVGSVVVSLLGGLAYVAGSYGDKPTLSVVGLAGIGVGAVLDIIGAMNYFSHLQWDYRRKQVDLYLSPTGVAIQF